MKTCHCIIIFLLSCISASLAANCYGPASKLSIIEFDAFPSPVKPGETVYIRANVRPGYEINNAKVQVTVYYSDKEDVTGLTPVVDIVGLDMCTLSSKVTCPIKAETVFEWEFLVPNILPGTYQVKYTILETSPPKDTNAYSCIQFSVTVAGDKAETYQSWYQAILLGTAVFDEPEYTARQVGQSVQVGPAGPLNFTSTTYGAVRGLTGSGEIMPNPYYDTSKFIWGLQGTLTSVIHGSRGRVTHIYTGTCYMGYHNPGSEYETYDHSNPIIQGHFNMTWVYSNSATAQVNGYVIFDTAGTIPHKWGYPVVLGRIARHEVVTSDVGFLMIKGNTTFCASGPCGPANPDARAKGSGLSRDELGLAIGLPIAVIFVVLLVAAALFWIKRRRETEQEDGVFAVARKPEYGSALVVDDIIEETKGNRTLQAMIDIQDEYSSEDDDSASLSSRSRSRTPSRSRSVSRSLTRSRSISRSSRGGIRSGEESDPGQSASRDSDSE